MSANPWAKEAQQTPQGDKDDPWTAGRMAEADAGDLWKPADHEGSLHLMICPGETRDFTSEYGDGSGSVVETMIVWDSDGIAQRFEDVLVMQQILKGTLAKPGCVAGILAKAGRAWIWQTPPQSAFDWIFGEWLPENSTGWPGGKPEITWWPDAG